MTVVVMTQFVRFSTDEEALQAAKLARLNGKRVEIISDAEYEVKRPKLVEMQDLQKWAKENGLDYSTGRTIC